MKTQPFHSKLPDVGTTIFTVMSGLANELGAINLSQGFPDFEIDPLLKKYVEAALAKEQVQYAPMAGRPDLIEMICTKMSSQHGSIFHPDEITITAGATQAIYTIFATLLRSQDEVILFDPAYDCYDPGVRVHGALPVHISLKHPSYSIDWNLVEDKINSKTRLIVVNNPHNPCGSVWTEEDIYALENILEKHPQLYILSDEVYEHIQFDGEHQSVLKSELIRSRSFVTYSFGKTFHVTGWKIGYCVAPRDLTKEFRKVHQFNVFCVNNTMQFALAHYMKNGNHWENVRSLYKKKRDVFTTLMEPSRFELVSCAGTYFALYSYAAISNETDVDFAKRITREFGVASIPLSVFYQDQTDHKVIRLCFAKKEETLIQGAKKLCLV